ncbi:MAG: DUF3857 and transglutaminase domain-containing protein, partial [Lentisphaeria bacterium]|nr:DUF3857 and transglutaminase domain-containing protein [Lentisphaeria bacterium]
MREWLAVWSPGPVRGRVGLWFAFAALACTASLSAGTAAEDMGLLDLAAVLQAAQGVTAERFPNADDVLVDDHILCRYQEDGTALTLDDTVVKILTEKGRQDNRTLTRHFTLPFSRADFLLVQVIKPDGTAVPVDVAAQSRVMVDRSQMGANIYNPDSKVLQVTIPELAIGDLVRYVAREELIKPRVPGTFSEYQVLEYTSPIVHYLYEVDGPRALPLRSIALKAPVGDTVAHSVREAEGRIVQRWEARDVPRMYSEPSMPPLYTVVQRLLISTIPDWEYLSRWYWDLSEPHFQHSEAIRSKVDELIRGVETPEARLRAVFRFVSQEIRYMGITVETEAPGYEPHDVVMTFENRHGVCRDKAALLVVMLRLAGFEAFPVLIHNGPRKDVEVPQPYFNHAIAAVANPDGGYTLMDPTDENTKELFPAYLCNQSYLVARPQGDTLRTSPIVPASENMMHVETHGRIDAQGNLRGESVLDFRGINDNAYRGHFSRLQPGERRRFFEGVVKRLAAGGRLTDLVITPTDMMDTETPLKVRLGFEADAIAVSNGTTTMLPVPRLGTRVGMVNFILGNAGLRERKYPFVNEFACGVEEIFRYELDAGLGRPVSTPAYDPIDTETLGWNSELRVEDGRLTGKGSFAIHTVEFSPDQYLALKETLKTLELYARKQPVFRVGAKDTEGADSILEQSITEIDVQDPHTWTTLRKVRRRILTYKGKKEHAELKWDT